MRAYCVRHLTSDRRHAWIHSPIILSHSRHAQIPAVQRRGKSAAGRDFHYSILTAIAFTAAPPAFQHLSSIGPQLDFGFPESSFDCFRQPAALSIAAHMLDKSVRLAISDGLLRGGKRGPS